MSFTKMLNVQLQGCPQQHKFDSPCIKLFFFFFNILLLKPDPQLVPKDADVENTVKLNAFMERRGSRLGVQMYLDFD